MVDTTSLAGILAASKATPKAGALSPAAIAAITAQQVAAGIKSTSKEAKLEGETYAQANARLTQGYKDQPKPDLTKEGAAAGATIEFVRTGAGGVGTYKEVFPMGTPIPGTRTTESGNVYDAQGKLISGTGLKTTGTATLKPGDPGYVAPKVLKFGDPGYVLKPGDPGYVAPNDSTGIPDRPIGTPPAFVYDPVTKTYKMPAKPTEAGNWTWDNNAGWTNTLVNPGASGMETGSDRTLAVDTFKNTLALFFGAKEMSQPWANALFKVVSSYYKTGATIDEALNLSLQDARNKPELADFTKRFAGVFALQDRRAAGEAIDVPTIAEFFKSQETLGDRLRQVGLADLATNEILGEVLGTGKSVAAVLGLVNNVFMAIDNAPKALKDDLAAVAPGVDRTSIAKALLLGKRGEEELKKKIDQVKVFSAAKSQGIKIADDLAADYAARGIDYGTALEGFGTVAMGSPTMQKLTEISNQTKSTSEAAQQTLMKSIFEKDVKAQEQIRLEAEKEAARFGGASGTMGSRSLASRNRANRII
jgi:hypothetical protein